MRTPRPQRAFRRASFSILRFACLLTACILSCSTVFSDTESKTVRPNILFIITDDLNDAISELGGHPQAQTPHIDRLASMGVSFTNAHCNSPLCAPSRASFLSGYHPHTSGYYAPHNPGKGRFHWKDNQMLRQSKTMMEHFTDEGYLVCGTGKVFHNQHEDWTHWFGADGINRFGVAPTWGPWPWNGQSPKSGWGGAVSHPGETEALGIDGNFASLANVPEVPADSSKGAPGYVGWRLFGHPFRYNSDEDRDLMPDELNAQWVEQQLTQDFEKPFFMVVGINRPHSPIYAPQKYFDRFPLEEIELLEARSDDLADTAEIFRTREMQSSTGLHGFQRYQDILDTGGEELLRKWTQAYLANIALVDDVVGRILDALENSPYADSTIIVFTSDHGYHMGDKELVFKNTLWDKATRVPLLFAGPGIQEGASCHRPVSLVDLFPTFNHFAKISNNPNEATHNMPLEGSNLQPLLENPSTENWNGPHYAISSIGVDALSPEGLPLGAETSHYAIRSQDFRYILYNNGEEELYHNAEDPKEWINLAHNPDYAKVKARLRALLDNR